MAPEPPGWQGAGRHAVLPVQLYQRHVGWLGVAEGGDAEVPEDWRFAYRPDYLESGGPALSVSLPLGPSVRAGAVVRNWFANLLPEGEVRAALQRRLRLPADDLFLLLAAIGGDCAGAVSIGHGGARADAPAMASLESLLAIPDHAGADWALLGGPRRLSLAGAQDKLAVVRDARGLRLPALDEPSSHILKPDHPRFPGTVDVEAFGMRVAAAAGLPVAAVELLELGGRRALLVTRFDRAVDATGRRQRVHQEDFCQALGLPPELKYGGTGGP